VNTVSEVAEVGTNCFVGATKDAEVRSMLPSCTDQIASHDTDVETVPCNTVCALVTTPVFWLLSIDTTGAAAANTVNVTCPFALLLAPMNILSVSKEVELFAVADVAPVSSEDVKDEEVKVRGQASEYTGLTS
jgi:hypothetical protein